MASMITMMSALAVAGGGLMYFTFPVGLRVGIGMFLNLKEGGMVYPKYINPPFGTTANYHIYEIKNPREVLRGKEMKLGLKGPYVYRSIILKENPAFLKSGDLLQFDSLRKMVPIEEKSANFDEKFYMLNPIVPGVLKQVRSMVIDRVPFQRITEPVVFNAVNVLLDNFNERLIVKTSARRLLDGRKVELLDSITNLASRFGLKSLVPPGPPENTFGLVFVLNRTIDKIEIWTGYKATEKFGDMSKWRGKQKMNIWSSNKCNAIEGTNGELFKPFIPKGKPLKIFLYPLCRSFYLDPVEEVTLSNNMVALEYELSQRLYQGARSNPGNKCYCSDTRTYDCQFDGLMSMGPCFFDSPIYFARGNLKGVDRRIRNLVDTDTVGKEISEKQSFYLDSTTGSLLAANLTFVAVFKFVKQPYMRDLSQVQNLTYAPLFSISESFLVPDEVVGPIKLLQYVIEYYEVAGIGMVVGGSLVSIARYLFFKPTNNKIKRTSPQKTPNPATGSATAGEVEAGAATSLS